MPSEGDPHSFSNPQQCKVTHIHMNLSVDFTKQILYGYAELTIEVKDPKAETLNLDCGHLNIKDVSDKNSGEKIGYKLEDTGVSFGSRFLIQLPTVRAEKYVIRVDYSTSPEATALLWLTPEQTVGKKHPYMFSQCEAIHARSLVPCQDTPGVKFTYTAAISAPTDLTVLMGAVRDGVEATEDPQLKRFKFVQKIPIPSYLMAIAVGDLESRKIGPISHVWAEKEYVDKAAFELSEISTILNVAEELLGPYVWGTCDLLVLPPSFPLGGMENPCLTFLTSELMAGDKSLLYVVDHEIAHSWTGNLVTNKNYEHFWLKEGMATYMERKMKARMTGESHRHLAALVGWNKLEVEIQGRAKDDPLTKLVPDLKGIDPDAAFSVIPYEKGCTLLFYLEQLLGGAETFDPFLKAFVEKFKGQSIDTNEWKAYVYEYFKDKKAVLDKVEWDAWLYSPGMPPVKPDFDESLAVKSKELFKAWVEATPQKCHELFSIKDMEDFSAIQVFVFMDYLLKEKPLSEEKVNCLTEIYRFENTGNSEIRFRWLRLGLLAHWKPIIQHAVNFVTATGSLKYIKYIYRDLYAWDETRELAISTYKKNYKSMLHISASAAAKELHLDVAADK